jgi:hypothetical protein
MTGITFESMLTPEGVVAFAALVTSLIALLKYTFPPLDARVSGALMAFALTAAGYALAAASLGVPTPDAALSLFVAWLSCATSAVGIHSGVQHLTATGAPSA